MERLIGATNPTLPVFTVDFDPKRPHSKPTVEVGKVDRQKYNGSLAYAPVNNKDGWWAVDNVSFEVGGQPIKPKQTMIIVCTSPVRGSNGTYGNVAAAFFKRNYVVFDYEKPAIQFAPHT
ncbi:MAG: hypothetical protein LQ338_006755 [Usnochroma carphineum]|nr:MAG: hypothetical protein LQ338_006755 [Usnochroma carphineum]